MLFTISGIFVAVTGLGLGLFVFLKKPKSHIHRVWALFNVCVGLWGLGVVFITTAHEHLTALLAWRLVYFPVIFIPITFIHFTLLFLKKKYAFFIKIIYLVGGLLSLINLTDLLGITNLFIVNTRLVFDSFYFDSPPSPLHVFFTVFFFSLVIYGLLILIQSMLGATGIYKTQLKYLFYSMFIGFAGGSTAFLPVYYIDIYPLLLLSFTIVVYPLAATYAIFRHRFMDITITVKKGAVYTVSLIIILTILTLISLLVRNILLKANTPVIYTDIIIIIIIALGFPIFKKYFDTLFERVFTKTQPLIDSTKTQIIVGAEEFASQTEQSIAETEQPTAEEEENSAEDELPTPVDLRPTTEEEKQKYSEKELAKKRAMPRGIPDLYDFIDRTIEEIKDTVKTNKVVLYLENPKTEEFAPFFPKWHPGPIIGKDNVLIRYNEQFRRPRVTVLEELIYQIQQGHMDSYIFERMRDSLKLLNYEVFCPMFAAGYIVGFLLLGKKSGRKLYSTNDIEYLEELATPFINTILTLWSYIWLIGDSEKLYASYGRQE